VTALFDPTSVIYNLVYFLLVFGFTYFYTSVVFNPERISENLQKSGGFIPGIRPGPQTSKYLNNVLNQDYSCRSVIFGINRDPSFIFPKYYRCCQFSNRWNRDIDCCFGCSGNDQTNGSATCNETLRNFSKVI
jgi:hypothetical protein